MTQSGQQTENQMKKHESNIRDLWDNIQWANLCIRGIPEGENNEIDLFTMTGTEFEKEIVKILKELRVDMNSEADYFRKEL